jgi:siroheme decarboxylase
MLDPTDRALIQASQAGLPLTPQPYHTLAQQLGISAAEVIQRLQTMLDQGIIRRIAAVPNHYALGYHANGMTVWDVDDTRLDELGMRIGQLEFVSHCYKRPRHIPLWTFNLFVMVHGHDRSEVNTKTAHIATLLGDACRAHHILYSSHILKKTGLRLI